MLYHNLTNVEYVTALGAEGVLKATKPGPKEGAPTVDELFVLEDSQPQFKLKSQPIPTETKIIPAMFASVKRGIEVQCCQSTTEDTEIFQFEINPATKQVTIADECPNKLVVLEDKQGLVLELPSRWLHSGYC
jgi:hypothetical protein